MTDKEYNKAKEECWVDFCRKFLPEAAKSADRDCPHNFIVRPFIQKNMILVSPRLLIRLMRHCRVVLHLTPESWANTRLSDNRRMLGAELAALRLV